MAPMSNPFTRATRQRCKKRQAWQACLCYFFSQTVLIFGLLTRSACATAVFEISACTTCATVLFVGCAFAQLVQTAQFLQVQLTQMAQEP